MTAADVNNITPKATATSSLEWGMANGVEGNRFWGSSNIMGLKVNNLLLSIVNAKIKAFHTILDSNGFLLLRSQLQHVEKHKF